MEAAAAAAEAKVCSSIQVGAHQTGEPFFFFIFYFHAMRRAAAVARIDNNHVSVVYS